MKNEFLMDSFGYISDEYIAEAASFQKRNRSVTWIPYAGIAAAFLSIIGIFFVVKSTVRREKTAPSEGTDTYLPETGLEESVPDTSGTEATEAMTRPAVDEGKVLFAPDKSAGECHDDMVGAPMGEVMMPYQLQQEIGKAENKDEYFSVTFMVCRFEYVEQYRGDEYAKYEACAKDPLIVLFNQEFGHWLYDIYMPRLTKEEQWAIEKQDDLGEISLEEIFIEEYWSKTQTEETQKEYLEAKRRFEEMAAIYPERVSEKRLIELFGERIKEDVHKEMDRLIGLGYRIEIVPLDEYVDREGFVIEGENGYHVYNGFTVNGYLTGEQLSSFGADPNHGYRFTWNTKDGEIGVSDE